MADYWFKRRRYGYGWTPTSTEGWLATGGYIIVAIAGAVVFSVAGAGDGIAIACFAVLTVAFVLLTLSKSPPPTWRWGSKPGDDPDKDL